MRPDAWSIEPALPHGRASDATSPNSRLRTTSQSRRSGATLAGPDRFAAQVVKGRAFSNSGTIGEHAMRWVLGLLVIGAAMCLAMTWPQPAPVTPGVSHENFSR